MSRSPRRRAAGGPAVGAGPAAVLGLVVTLGLSACSSAHKTAEPVLPSAPVSSSPVPSPAPPSSGCPKNATRTINGAVTDAAAARNTLLAAVCSAPYDGRQEPYRLIAMAWERAAPNLAEGLFTDTLATPTTVSTSNTFLFDDADPPNDQIFSFAVTDGHACAGGIAVIPADRNGKPSTSKRPTKFFSVDVAADEQCNAQSVQTAWKPGSVRPGN